MTIGTWLREAQSELNGASVSTAHLDSLVLLEDELQQDRALLLAHPELELSRAQEKRLGSQIERRKTHEPLAYIRGKTEFYGRDFVIEPGVLEPRPESETIIDILKALRLPAGTVIADIGTGSGMLAVTAQLEIPGCMCVAVDVDKKCIQVARANCQKFKLELPIYKGNLLDPLQKMGTKPQVLLCNLPYVPDSFQINTAAGHEPRQAIFGGADGLDLYRELFTQAENLPQRPQYILTESLPPQHSQLAEIASTHGYQQITEDDFIQLFQPSA